LKTDGQQINLNYPPRPPGDPTGGPCYRCVFPKPPPADQLVSCGEGGIVGPVVGMMGVLQASEAIKLIVAGVSVEDTTKSEFEMGEGLPPPSMLIFAANSSAPFRTISLRSRRPDCFACSAKAGLTRESLTSGSLDYVAFCGEVTPVNLLGPDERVAAEEFARLQKKGKQDCLLLDVREKVQFDIAHLDGSVNVPFSDFQGGMSGRLSKDMGDEWLPPSLSPDAPIYVVCRLGNDSQVVVKKLKEKGYDNGGKRYIGDIRGGLRAWREHVDGSWPDY
jgi:adenylyltransferase/sulfurtransferase